jgi:serine/threonine protein phosphatase PrpC
MSTTKNYIEKLFYANNIAIKPNRMGMFEEFTTDEENIKSVKTINDNQQIMMNKWVLKTKIMDILDHPFQIPNGTVGKSYQTVIDFNQLGWNDLIHSEFVGLEECGLAFDSKNDSISGTPTTSGEYKIKFLFRVDGEDENAPLNEKNINLIINADPKSLWKSIDSDQNDPYWKEDNVADFQPLGDKHIVIASKRGRSHANVGSFRDDDYAFKFYENTGWSVVAVADGAGSAKASRKGSQIACQEVVNYFENHFTPALSAELDQLITEHQKANSETIEDFKNKIGIFTYNHLGSCANSVHNKLEEFAQTNQINIKELHTTLIFTLFKKYDFGYGVMTFGVGDCPIGIVNIDQTDFKLMNWLDVGEFGGGTRFITMPEIFTSDKLSTRFGFTIMEDFSYLMLMTDGIYDAKFVVESNLEKLEKWNEFIADLKGNNDDQCAVVFDPNNSEIAHQLSQWMDFWSPGNHDDRTLAIIF